MHFYCQKHIFAKAIGCFASSYPTRSGQCIGVHNMLIYAKILVYGRKICKYGFFFVPLQFVRF